MEIRKIKFKEIPEDFLTAAKKDSLSFLAGEDVHYWGAFDGPKLIGCTSLCAFKNNHGKIKSNYVLPEYRRQGIFTQLNKICVDYAKFLQLTNVTLNCLESSVSVHTKAGAVQWKDGKRIKYMVYRF